MTHALAPRVGRRLRAVPYIAFTTVVATALVSTLGIASSSFLQRDTVQASGSEVSASSRSADAPNHVVGTRSRSRCVGCGVVEDIQPLEAAADRPAQFRFTVRMRDGSVRVSRSIGRAQWVVGDRIMLMGGARIAGD